MNNEHDYMKLVNECKDQIKYEAEYDGHEADFSEPFYSELLNMEVKARLKEILARLGVNI